jgi:drug/metabolite transporter (DMT)-like permease
VYLGVLLATSAALCYGAGVALQQQSASAAERAGHLDGGGCSTAPPGGCSAASGGFWRRLLARPGWWLGSLLNAVGYLLQGAALRESSLVVVQSILLTSTVSSHLVAAWLERRRPAAAEGGASLVLCGGLALFLLGGQTTASGRIPPLLEALGLLLALLAVLGLLVRIVPTGRQDVALASAAGVAFGCAAVCLKLGALQVGTGWQSWLLNLPLALAGLLTWLGFCSLQRAFAVGPLARTYPVAMVLDPLTAALVGWALLGEAPHVGGRSALEMAAGLIAMAAGLGQLCARHAPAGDQPAQETAGPWEASPG